MNFALKKSVSRSGLTAALSFAALTTFSGWAQADALAQSYLAISKFVITPSTAVSNGSVSGRGKADVELNNVTAGTGFVNGNALGNFTAPISVGAGYVAQNAILGAVPGSFAGGTSSVQGIGISSVPGFTTGADALSDSVVSLKPSGSGESITSTRTTFGWDFTVVSPTALTFSFDASMFLRTYLEGTPVLSGNADSSVNWSVAIQNSAGTTVFSWAPDGGGAGISGSVGGTVQNDSFSLNTTISSTVGVPESLINKIAGGAFKATTGSFAAGSYSLNITHKTDAFANIEVPEPGTLALVGLSLVGLAAVGRRRAIRQAA